MKRTRVLLTGATGNMGREGLKQFYKNNDKFHLVILALPTAEDKKMLARYRNDDSVSIVWGDLTNYEDVKKAVDAVDIILHLGALVSPMADHNPELAWKVNYGGTKNIVDAINSRSDSDEVKLIFIGTVAQTGSRPAPYHWGRIGDPLIPSPYDYYALSKVAAERLVIESGLKNWVSLRQTGILHDKFLNMNDGIAYHQPLNNHLEWVTAKDSGRLLLNICSKNLPAEFWCNVYNIGGGELCRLSSYSLYKKIYDLMGVDFRKFQHPNWYALRNFHGQYYYDSDKLEEYLHFREESIDDVILKIKRKLPYKMRILKFLPASIIRKIMRKEALKGDTPLRWIEYNDEDKIKAFFGSRNKWEQIPDWEKFKIIDNPPNIKLNHGYDEEKNINEITLNDIRKAAKYRGGKCLSTTMKQGDLYSNLKWKCAHGHEFEASPFLVIKTGHWCPECIKAPWNFDEQAKHSSFIAQIWHIDHNIYENNLYH